MEAIMEMFTSLLGNVDFSAILGNADFSTLLGGLDLSAIFGDVDVEFFISTFKTAFSYISQIITSFM